MKSMTGFGKSSEHDESIELSAEINSVNNRFLEINIRQPKEFSMYENKIRSIIKGKVNRGKLNINLSVSILGRNDANPGLGYEKSSQIFDTLNLLKDRLKIKEPVTLQNIIDYFAHYEDNSITLEADDYYKLAERALNSALGQLDDMRLKEGQNLQEDISKRLESISTHTADVQEKAKDNVQKNFDRMVENVQNLLNDKKIESGRLEQEIAIISDKVDITEECVRMESHLKLFLEAIREEKEVGKKLNFILQEMLREANTMNSKNADLEIQHKVIKIKEEIEKIREQVQNIE